MVSGGLVGPHADSAGVVGRAVVGGSRPSVSAVVVGSWPHTIGGGWWEREHHPRLGQSRGRNGRAGDIGSSEVIKCV